MLLLLSEDPTQNNHKHMTIQGHSTREVLELEP